MANFDINIHSVRLDRTKIRAERGDGARWIVLEFEDYQTLTLFFANDEDFLVMATGLNAQVKIAPVTANAE